MLESERHIKFGKLFYEVQYIDDIRLLTGALSEIFEILGHTIDNPVSLYWYCYELGIPFGIIMRINLDITVCINKNELNNSNAISIIREIVIKHFPEIENFKFKDKRIEVLANVLSDTINPELKPYLDKI